MVPLAEQPTWIERVWARVREEVGSGRQVYVVCPRISGDDKSAAAEDTGDPLLDTEGDGPSSGRPPLAAVEEVAPSWATGRCAGCASSSCTGGSHRTTRTR